MKANELMIGDWVYMEAHKGYEAQYIQVETIPDASSKDHYGHIGAFPVGGDNDFRDIEDRHLFPIPLTNEILWKNLPDPEIVFWYPDNNTYRISIGDDVALNIKYVHELQHALRLCGIEKEIEL